MLGAVKGEFNNCITRLMYREPYEEESSFQGMKKYFSIHVSLEVAIKITLI